MDVGAELTLQMARLIQMRPGSTHSPVGWSLWPHGSRFTWDEARAFLAAAEKPILVAPLVEPGALAVFALGQFPDAQRRQFAAEFANQVQYYKEKLKHLALTDAALLRFEPAASECVLSVSAFIQWAHDYALAAGISLAPSGEPGVGRITVRPPGGGGPPMGA